ERMPGHPPRRSSPRSAGRRARGTTRNRERCARTRRAPARRARRRPAAAAAQRSLPPRLRRAAVRGHRRRGGHHRERREGELPPRDPAPEGLAREDVVVTSFTCRRLRPALVDLAEGTLAPGAKRRVEAHVASCATCREDLEAMRGLSTELRDPTLPEPPDDFWR